MFQQCRRSRFDSWVRKIHWRKERLPTPVFSGFPCGSAGKESTCNAGDLGLIPVLEDPLEKGKAMHSSILAWRIPWTIQSMGSQKVRHDWVTFNSYMTKHATIIQPKFTLEHLLQINENLYSLKMYMGIHRRFIFNNEKWKQQRSPSMSE